MPYLKRRQKRRSYTRRQYGRKDFGNNAYKFYNGQTWRKASHQYRADHPVCEVCGQPAEMVDHIIPIIADDNGQPLPEGGAALDPENLMQLCHRCHNRKRGKEAHGFRVEAIQGEYGAIPARREEVVNELKK